MTSVHIDVTMAFVSTNPIFVTEESIVPMIIQMSETVRLMDLFQNLRLNRLDVERILKLCVQIKVNNFSIIFLLNLFVYIWQKLVVCLHFKLLGFAKKTDVTGSKIVQENLEIPNLSMNKIVRRIQMWRLHLQHQVNWKKKLFR